MTQHGVPPQQDCASNRCHCIFCHKSYEKQCEISIDTKSKLGESCFFWMWSLESISTPTDTLKCFFSRGKCLAKREFNLYDIFESRRSLKPFSSKAPDSPHFFLFFLMDFSLIDKGCCNNISTKVHVLSLGSVACWSAVSIRNGSSAINWRVPNMYREKLLQG